ncbi:MAG: hypothetical protein L3K14_06610 [Thermoplasmata archaeon]|nr:hypothetical protein [Thermoplasmata archaeon]
MSPSAPRAPSATDDELVREAEAALRNLGFTRARSTSHRPTPAPSFWVQGPSAHRRSIPVYVDRAGAALPAMMLPADASPDRENDFTQSILVVPTDAAAESAWGLVPKTGAVPAPAQVRILVLRDPKGTGHSPHWHLAAVPPREVLRLATGIVVGMYRRAFSGAGHGDVDFSALLGTLRDEYHIDVPRSLGVQSDEDALFILYHLALRDTFAPGNIAGNLHSIVANPTGPASRIPWFAG